MSHTGGLSAFANDTATYISNLNYLMIYGMDPRKRRVAIVHEATHVIQDWEDVASLTHHSEADAFIAESVAELVLYPNSRDPDDGDVEKKALAAAQMVIDKAAIDSSKSDSIGDRLGNLRPASCAEDQIWSTSAITRQPEMGPASRRRRCSNSSGSSIAISSTTTISTIARFTASCTES